MATIINVVVLDFITFHCSEGSLRSLNNQQHSCFPVRPNGLETLEVRMPDSSGENVVLTSASLLLAK